MTDRRYSEEEISEIFSRAAEEPQRLPAQAARDKGLTLPELQEIGREVGISADAVAYAARSLEIQRQPAAVRFLGLPISVERSLTLDRSLTDAEWEQLVVQFREVFNARGRVAAYGNFREWTNGNLQALLEPTPTGHRLTLRTTKGTARSGIGAGSAIVGVGLAMSAAAAATGHFTPATPGVLMMTLVGAAMVASNALGLPTWAKRRERQMDAILSGLAEKAQS